jgi:chromosome segregation ATPase
MRGPYRGLGFDPAPGDLDSVTQTATQFTAAAEQLATAEPAVRKALAAGEQWHGAGSDAFRQHLSGVPESLASRPASLRAAASVLEDWAQTLATNKGRAEDLDRTALGIRRDLDTARDDLQEKQNTLDLAATPTAAASASIETAAAAKRVSDLEHRLDTVLGQGRDLERTHRLAADQVAARLTGEPTQRDPSTFGRSLGDALRRGTGLANSLATAFGGRASRPSTAPTGAASALASALSGGRP